MVKTGLVSHQVKTPVVNTKSRVLVPGLPGHQASVKGPKQGSEKRKKDTDTKEVSSVVMRHQAVAHCILLVLRLTVYCLRLGTS